jgi:histidinol-phosphatase (PHP family)
MYDFERFKPIITRILQTIIQKNKGIELNTSGFRYGLGVMHTRLELLTLYKNLGGKIITLGSDAHYLKDYQKDFDAAIRLLRAAGFTEVAQFEDRKSRFVSII